MYRRPFLLFLSTLLFLYFPLEWGYQLYQGHPFHWIDALLDSVLPFFLMFGLLRVTRVGWYTLVALIALLGIRDLNTYYTVHGKPWSLFSHLGIYLFSLSYFINPRVRHLYFDPKLRWWRTKPRFETYLPLIMNLNHNWDYPVMKNISEGGCFLETKEVGAVADKVFLKIPLPIPLSVSVIKVEGEVRWVNNSENKQGMGIQFRNLTPTDQFAIQEFVRLGL